MEGSNNLLIRALTERTMSKIVERRASIAKDTSLYNIIYEEIQARIEITIASERAKGK